MSRLKATIAAAWVALALTATGWGAQAADARDGAELVQRETRALLAPAVLGAALAVALVAGFGAGWLAGRTLRLTMPNAAVATAVLVLGSVGGPVVSAAWLGAGPLSFVAAVFVAGGAAGLTFWPMGETQGERRWL
jgi:hypothetical protein